MQVNLVKKMGCVASYFMAVFCCINVVQASELKLASWNIEWLTSKPVNAIPNSRRTGKDFSKLSAYLQDISPDVLAFQEVNSSNIIKQLAGRGYSVYLSDRHTERYISYRFDDINQFTGFAVRNGYRVEDVPDLHLSSSDKSKLRFASYIILYHEGRPLHLLTVHLKAGCKGKRRSTASCRLLKQEAGALNVWIKERVRDDESFVILGDFNHNLAYPKDWLWQVLNKGAAGSVVLLSADTKPRCQVRSYKKKGKLYRFRTLIDHVIASSDLTTRGTNQHVYKEEDVWNYHLSDHCPISTVLIAR